MRTGLSIVLACAASLSFGQAQPFDLKNMMVAREFAYMVAPPRMVSNDVVTTFRVSPDGRFVLFLAIEGTDGKLGKLLESALAQSTAVGAKPVFRIWDVLRDKTSTLSVSEGTLLPNLGSLVWSSQPGVAFELNLDYDETDPKNPKITTSLMRLSAPDLSFRAVWSETGAGGHEGTVYCSPTRPIVVDAWQRTVRDTTPSGRSTIVQVRAFDLNGNKIAEKDTKSTGYVVFQNQWLADGTHMVALQAGPTGKFDATDRKRLVVDARTGTLTPTTENLTMYTEKRDEPPFALQFGKLAATEDRHTEELDGLWLAATKPSEKTEALVTAEHDGHAELLPDLKTVVYTARGRLYACEIAKMDKAVYLAAKERADRIEALKKAKQIGIAVALFASDHGDMLPGPDGLQNALYPYMKDSKMFDGFVYTFKGGNAANIEDPSHTELGYFRVPGGRAVVMSDTSARFIKDP